LFVSSLIDTLERDFDLSFYLSRIDILPIPIPFPPLYFSYETIFFN